MLSINISELLLTILSFFVLMFLLNKLLFKPVISFREQRQNRMDESFRQESLAKEKQAQAREEAQQQRLAGLKQAQDIAEQTQAQAGAQWQAAEKQIEQEAQAAMAAFCRTADLDPDSINEAMTRAVLATYPGGAELL